MGIMTGYFRTGGRKSIRVGRKNKEGTKVVKLSIRSSFSSSSSGRSGSSEMEHVGGGDGKMDVVPNVITRGVSPD